MTAPTGRPQGRPPGKRAVRPMVLRLALRDAEALAELAARTHETKSSIAVRALRELLDRET